ncbi:hypothetical protein BC833DRAFT_608016 [Globomyces pollinis-pini]|nr:hypothetical protein BC833DRAFT_608016 [Globomyces pollinis-pini]
MLQPEAQSVQNLSESITPDGGIVKIPIITKTGPKINWTKGFNAKFHYTVHAYIVPTNADEKSTDTTSEKDTHCCHDHSSSGSHHKHDHSCQTDSKQREELLKSKMEMVEKMLSNSKKKKVKNTSKLPLNPAQKPVRTLISDSRKNDKNPFELRIGYSFSVTAMEIAIKTMKVGEKSRFLCMPEYCEGFIQLETIMRQEKMNNDLKSQGKPPINFSGCCAHMTPEMMEISQGLEDAIGCPFEFEFELISIQKPDSFSKEAWELSPNEKYQEIPLRKNEGGELYKKGNWVGALEKYERCLVLLETLSSSGIVLDLKKERMDKLNNKFTNEISIIPEDNLINLDDLDAWMKACRLNYAACKLKLKDYPSVIVQCTEVLQHDTKCSKAYFRRGQAYCALGRDLDLAEKDFERCGQLLDISSGEYNELNAHIKLLNQKLKAHAQKEKSMYGGKLFN